MSIQQNINQLAAVGTALYTQSPSFEAKKQAKVEAKEIARKSEAFDKALNEFHKGASKITDPIAKNNMAAELKGSAMDLYQLTGDPKYLRQYNVAHTIQQKYEKEMEFEYTGKMNEPIGDAANMRAQTQHEATLKQKANIKSRRDELLNMPTSLGGKLKDLSPELQETLIKEYEKNGK